MKYLIITCQIYIFFVFGCSIDHKNRENIGNNENEVTEEKMTKDSLNSIVFKYGKMDMVRLNGNQVIGKETKNMKGQIEFKKDEIKVYSGNTFEKFIIDNVIKQDDGYQIETKNNKGDRCTISVIRRQGNDFVTTHFIDIDMMGMFYINEGFTINMEIYNTY